MLKTIHVDYTVSEFEPLTLESKVVTDVDRTLDRAFIEQGQDESDCSEFCLVEKIKWLS